MRIRLLKPHRRNGFLHKTGTILDANPDTVNFLIRRGAAVQLDINQPTKRRNPGLTLQ
jgi:hypothetical protein